MTFINKKGGAGCLLYLAVFAVIIVIAGIKGCSISPEQEAVDKAREKVETAEFVVKSGKEELEGYRAAMMFGDRQAAMKLMMVTPIVREDEQKLADAQQELADAKAALERKSHPTPAPTPDLTQEEKDANWQHILDMRKAAATPPGEQEAPLPASSPVQTDNLQAELAKSQEAIRQQYRAAMAATPTPTPIPVPTPISTPTPTPTPLPTPESTPTPFPEPTPTPLPKPTPDRWAAPTPTPGPYYTFVVGFDDPRYGTGALPVVAADEPAARRRFLNEHPGTRITSIQRAAGSRR
jgi:hypothetical protein